MPGFGMLQDDFADGTVDPVKWAQSYGDPTEAGGRGRIPCTTGYAALRSASAYTLTASQVALRVHPPAPGGAGSAVLSVLVLSDTGGTDAGFIVDSAQGSLGIYSRVGYADAGALFPAYDLAAHAWLRLREDGGQLRWEASPDGRTWVLLRTTAAPAWTAQTSLSLLLEAHRDGGLGDVAEVDHLNITQLAARMSASSRTEAGPGPYARRGPTLQGG